MNTFLRVTQLIFLGLIFLYGYKINYQAPLFQNPNLTFVISFAASCIGFLSSIILIQFRKLKKEKTTHRE